MSDWLNSPYEPSGPPRRPINKKHMAIGLTVLAAASAALLGGTARQNAQRERVKAERAERSADRATHQLGLDATRTLAESKMAAASPVWLPDPLGRMTWTYSAPVVVQGRSGTLTATVLRDNDVIRTNCKIKSRVGITYAAADDAKYNENWWTPLCHPALHR
jgi:hypothetical protein